MTEKHAYRHWLIDREGHSSPVAMRAFSRYWFESHKLRQTAACDFYIDLTRRYLRMRRFDVGVHKVNVRQRLPSEFGNLFLVVGELFMRSDEGRNRLVHSSTRGAVHNHSDGVLWDFYCGKALYGRHSDDEPWAFYCDGALYVFSDHLSLIRELSWQVTKLERIIQDIISE